jgi:hypothetical protein
MGRLITPLLLAVVLVNMSPAVAQTNSAAPPKTSQSVASPTFDGFDDFVASVMRVWKVPGVAVVAIQGDKITLLQ